MSAKQKKYRHNVKIRGIAAYGGRCIHCGEHDIAKLCIPRRLGNDNYWTEIERLRDEEPAGGWNLYVWLRVRAYPKNFGFEVFCKTCAKEV